MPSSQFDNEIAYLTAKARQYVQLSRRLDQLADARKPIPRELSLAVESLQAEYSLLDPQTRSFIDDQLVREKYAQSTGDLVERETFARANQLRNRDAVSREVTKGLMGEKEGLSAENYQRVIEDPHEKKITLPTGRARLDENLLQELAAAVNPGLGLKADASWRETSKVLDRWEDLKNTNPEKFEKAVISRGVDRQFLDNLLDEWPDLSLRIGWTEHLAKKDDEAGLEDEQEVEISDSTRRRMDLINATVNHAAEAAQEDPKVADDFGGEISRRYREDAVDETLELRRKPNARGDEISMRDALTRAYDKLEEQDASYG